MTAPPVVGVQLGRPTPNSSHKRGERRQVGSRSQPTHTLALTLVLLSCPVALRAEARVTWSVVNGELDRRGNALLIGDGPQRIELGSGWSCVVGTTSKALPLYEARQTACTKGSEAVEFSVQCEPNRPKDHTQIRFRDPQGRLVDFVEVWCELK